MTRPESWFNYVPPAGHGALGRTWHRHGRSGLFRTADLNAIGWITVLGPGLAAGLLAARILDRPWWLFVIPGALASYLMALGADAIAWRRIPCGMDLPDGISRPEVDSIADRLRSEGVDVAVLEIADPEPGRSRFSLESTNRSLATIQRALATPST